MNQNATKSESAESERAGYIASLRRWMLAFLGILCVAVGALGVIIPGLPTTIFLLAACYLFARSCPHLEKILVRNRFFAAFHQYLDDPGDMPRRAKVFTLIAMWTCITGSTIYVLAGLHWQIISAMLIPVAGIIGTCVFLYYFRNRSVIAS